MSLQGPVIVVAETPASDLVDALGAAGAFPIVEAKWADAPTAFVAVKPAAIVIAEPGAPPSETNARMLCLQVATAAGPVVPVIARTFADQDAAVPIALPADASLPIDRLITRLRSALRVRALHSTVLRRIDTFAAHGSKLPALPVGDALEDATVLVTGRGPLYPKLSVAMGERVGVVGALSVEAAARHMNSRDIDGVVIGDGFSQRMIEAFLTVLAQNDRFRDIPVVVIGDVPPDLAERFISIDRVGSDPARAVARMVPLVRLHAFQARLTRMLNAIETEGMFDAETGLLSYDYFLRDLSKSVADAANGGHSLSLARISFEAPLGRRARLDGARLVTRLTRSSDFACQGDDGAILAVFAQTDLNSAHVAARRMAAALRNKMVSAEHDRLAAHVTLATLKANDNVDSLLTRVMGGAVVAAK
ncbi:MAG: GGDEF domain-containing protein [Pseudolabrys sp.]